MGSVVLLPNGKQQFLDNNGAPLSGGKVYFYVAPATTTPKNTWKDSARAVLNANPVLLDAAGEAVIFGVGDYRQIVNDALGNLIWDAQTSGLGGDTYGGVSTGSANAQVLSSNDFAARNGQLVSFVAGFSNSGATTVNAGFGATAVYKITASGPALLTGGEIVANNSVLLSYDSVNTRFYLLSSVAYLTSALAATTYAALAGNQTFTGGFIITPANLGNITNFTLNPVLGNYQFGINHAAATWTAPVNDCAIDILVTNDATAGAITFSGFTVAAGNTGDALTVTNTSKFLISIRRINAISTYVIKALQ